MLNLDADSGALVQSVVPDSPADEAGIEAGDAQVTVDGQRIRAGGDVITAVDGEPVDRHGRRDRRGRREAARRRARAHRCVRGGDERTVTVELADRPDQAGG